MAQETKTKDPFEKAQDESLGQSTSGTQNTADVGGSQNLYTGGKAEDSSKTQKTLADAESDKKTAKGQDHNEGEKKGYWRDRPAKKERRSVKRKAKSYLVRGTIVGTIISIVISAMSLLLPMKLEFIVKNIEARIGSVSEYAVENRVDAIVGRYLTHKIMRGATAGDTVFIGNTLLGTVMGNLNKAKFELTLRDKYGLRIQATSKGTPLTVRPGGRQPDGWRLLSSGGTKIDIDGLNIDLKKLDANPDAKSFRRTIKRAIKNETRFFQVFKRYNTWRILRKSYRVPSRFVPKFVTNAKASYGVKKVAFKKWIVNRVITPFSSNFGLLFNCMFDYTECRNPVDSKPESARTPTSNEVDDALQGPKIDPETGEFAPFDKDASSEVLAREVSGEFDGPTPRNVKDQFLKELIDGGSAFDKTAGRLVKVFRSELTKRALTTVGVVGLVHLAANIHEALQNNAIGKTVYGLQSMSMVNHAASLLTISSQIKEGDMSSEDINIVMDSIDGFQESPLYQAEHGVSPVSSALSFSGDNVYAEDENSLIPYDCDSDGFIEGTPGESLDYVSKDDPVCSHMKLARDYRAFTQEPWYKKSIGAALDIYNATVGGVFGGIIKVVDSVIGFVVDPILSQLGVDKALAKGVEYVADHFMSPSCTGFEEGPLNYDCVRAGMEVMSAAESENSEDGVGGYYQEAVDHNEVISYQAQQRDEEWREQSLFARLFSTDSERSLVAKLIMKTPSDTGSSMTNVATTLASPFKFMASSFGSLIAPARAATETPADWNPFGIIHYGFDLDDPNLSTPPGEGVYANCETEEGFEAAELARENTMVDPDGDGPLWELPSQANYCALEKASLEAVNALLQEPEEES